MPDVVSGLFNNVPIRPGSVLLVHSSTARIMRKYGVRPHQILDSLLDKVGKDGTLVLPLFNFEFTTGAGFDIRSTASQMGALTEQGRCHAQAVRTGHPVYSFAAIGARAEEFRPMDNRSAYGPDSPFAKLRELDGDIAVIDLPDQHSMTFYHHVEELLRVPYRFHKDFTGPYTDWGGITSTRTYNIFVRDLDAGVKTSVDRMGERLWAKGLYRGDRPRTDSGTRIINAKAMFDEVKAVIEAGDAEQYLFEYDR